MYLIMYFQLVFDMLVLQKHNTEMTTAAGEAFYTLVCLHQVLHPLCTPALVDSGTPKPMTPGTFLSFLMCSRLMFYIYRQSVCQIKRSRLC
jgi:hypothetical protein